MSRRSDELASQIEHRLAQLGSNMPPPAGDPVYFLRQQLMSQLRDEAEASSWQFPIAIGSMVVAYVVLFLAFQNSFAGDFEWLAYLAGTAVVIGTGWVSSKITTDMLMSSMQSKHRKVLNF